MNQRIKETLKESMSNFALPRYDELPDVGLYLEQVTQYISTYLEPLEGVGITSSMISNYVKKGLVESPVKKQYGREQIAYLMFIAVVKSVISLDDIGLMMEEQKETYSPETAYNYFCMEMENLIGYVFGLKETVDVVGEEDTLEKVMLRNMIITVAHKVYLDKYFAFLQKKKYMEEKIKEGNKK